MAKKAEVNGVATAVANGRSVAKATKRILAVGPITIQTKMYLAASNDEGISFNMIHAACRSKVKQAGYFCPCCVEVKVLKDFKYQPAIDLERDAKARAQREEAILKLKKGDPVPPQIMPVPFIECKKGSVIIMHSRDVADAGEKKVEATEQKAMIEGDDIAKGYDLGNEQFITISKDEIKEAKAVNDDLMMVEQFVPLSQVNPLYFQKSHYLECEPMSSQPYALLRTAMVRENVAAVAKVTTYQTERLIFIVPYGDTGMAVHESFLPDEIRAISFASLDPVSKEEEKVAVEFVKALTGNLNMTKYTDAYQANLKALIESKKKGEVPAPVEQKVAPKAGGNVMDLLRAGIINARKKAA